MTDIERERAVADAIVLEQAAQVLTRRQPEYPFSLEEQIAFLLRVAANQRLEAERDD
jgi:predicted nucleic acid-binding protein